VNDFFAGLGQRWADLAAKRGATISAPMLGSRVAEEILQLARVVAHSKERSFAPLASFIAGVAAERFRVAKGASEDDIASYVREVREALEREAGPA
jgi:hypothetical protein